MDEFKDYRFVWAFTDINKHDVLRDDRLILVNSKSKKYYKSCSFAILRTSFLVNSPTGNNISFNWLGLSIDKK